MLAWKSFWAEPLELLGDVGHLTSHFGLFGTVLVSVQDKCMVCAKRTIGLEIILDAPNVHLSDEAQVVARFSPFGHDVILMQDRCTVCTERTIGSEIILDAPNVHLGDEAQLVARFVHLETV